ncbi:hypothetical protein Cme02nite_39640 [Catellatospora methionotrophica]|uniref:Uncharacterized protein n=1 Tax=Catellatospora methionotrophica TaxID=121620 RepID=A0A8J3PFW5_9ACTN|nr:hypothetical protein Cme02nite_39640 [Catellatospora methionotrophica]
MTISVWDDSLMPECCHGRRPGGRITPASGRSASYPAVRLNTRRGAAPPNGRRADLARRSPQAPEQQSAR